MKSTSNPLLCFNLKVYKKKPTAERLATNNTLIWLLQARKKTLPFLDVLGVKANVTNK